MATEREERVVESRADWKERRGRREEEVS